MPRKKRTDRAYARRKHANKTRSTAGGGGHKKKGRSLYQVFMDFRTK